MIKHITVKRIIVFLICLLVLIRFLYIFVPFDRDEGAYAYIGWLWFTGQGIPYLSAFDPKLPFSYIPYGIGSLLTPYNFIGPRIIAFVYEIAILVVFYRFAKAVTANKTLSVFVTLLVGFFYASIRLEGSQFNTEIEMVLPMIIFSYLLWKEAQKEKSSKRILFLIGLVGGTTLLFKTAGAIAIGSLVVWYLFYKKDYVGFLTMALGIVTIMSAVALYFHANHALSDMYKDVFIYNQSYTREGLILSDIYIRGGATGVIGVVSWFLKMPGVLFLFTLFSLSGLVITRKTRTALWWICAVLFVTLWIGIKLGGREFPHYYLFLPFVLGLSSLIVFEKILKIFGQKMVVFIILFFISLIVLPESITLIKGPHAVLTREFGGQSAWFSDAVNVGRYIRKTYPDKMLLAWANEPEICYYAGKKCISKYVNLYGFFYFKDEKTSWLNEIRKNPPPLIVTYADDPSSFVDVEKFLKEKPIYKKVYKSASYILYERIR